MRSTGPCCFVIGASAAKIPCATSQVTMCEPRVPAQRARFARLPVEKLSSDDDAVARARSSGRRYASR